ncbi:protein FAR1-RELATED SEQUENCE [Trifolium repens]|nr:protein FAR1-RELATED SEQUENCE [Trifolium repens]
MDLMSSSSEFGPLSVVVPSGPLDVVDSSETCVDKKEYWESLVFKSIEEVEKFYGDYAFNNGFSVRTMLKSTKNSQNKPPDKVHYLRYVCNKQGYKKGSLLDPKNKPTSDSPVVVEFEKVKEKAEERIGCKAGIFLKLDVTLNAYKIYRWDVPHCHPLHKAEHGRFLRSFRVVNEVQGQLAVINSKAGMSMRTSYEVMGQGVGGTENLPFRFSDLKNYLMTKRQKEMVVGEATVIQEFFRNEALSKPSFYYDIQVDAAEDIASIFWADGIMQLDYALFGDVTSFDTTYRTNNQYRPLAAFMGFDNHRKSVLFGVALLYDETAATFDWLFTTFLRCMANKKPKTIYTDQATALLKSVPNIFDGVFHGLCSWHMQENAKKNLGSRANSAFFDELNILISSVDNEADFDYNWDQMMKKSWVKSHFTAGLKTTQLSESFNAFLRGFLQPDHSLVRFFSHFNMMVQRMRDNHAESDFKAANTRTKNNYPNSQLMRSVVNKYTPSSFAFIHRQYDLSFKYYYEEDATQVSPFIKVFKVFTIEQVHEPDEVFAANYDDVGNEVVLDEVINENLLAKSVDHHHLDERVVTIDTDKKRMSCTCRMFENRGFLCRHVFRILEYLGGSVQYHGLKTIPAEYVLKRWCRDARQSFDKLNSNVDVANEATTQAQRYQQICAVTVQLSTRVSVDPEASQIFLNGVLCKTQDFLYSWFKEY